MAFNFKVPESKVVVTIIQILSFLNANFETEKNQLSEFAGVVENLQNYDFCPFVTSSRFVVHSLHMHERQIKQSTTLIL